jgi:hypothetical protein
VNCRSGQAEYVVSRKGGRMKFLLAVVAAAVVLCGCASNDQGGMNSSSGEDVGGSSSQREIMRGNHVSDNVKNPSSNWNTP